MKIADANFAFSCRQRYEARLERNESLQVFIGTRGLERPPANDEDRRSISTDVSMQASSSTPASAEVPCPEENEESFRLRLVETLVKMLTGKEIKIVPLSLKDITSSADDSHEAAPSPQGTQSSGSTGGLVWEVDYDARETFSESEELSLSAEGTIQTTDGETFAFTLSFSMSRTYAMERSTHLTAGNARVSDPLVVDFGGGTIRFGETLYPFDLHGDGTTERIPFVSHGSGFLALDKDGDGQIKDGGELFGPTTGDGFAELAFYDDDGNGWIDDGDAVLRRLRLWVKPATGEDALLSLSDVGIAAISLDRVIAPFHFKDAQGGLQGAMRQAGIFLREDRTAGVIAQIDLVV